MVLKQFFIIQLIVSILLLTGCRSVHAPKISMDSNYQTVAEAGYKPYQFDNGDDYVSDGLYRIVDANGKIGYASEDNRVIIAPRFAFGIPFVNGRAKVTDSGHLKEVPGSNGEYHYWVSDYWYWIDKTGKKVNME